MSINHIPQLRKKKKKKKKKKKNTLPNVTSRACWNFLEKRFQRNIKSIFEFCREGLQPIERYCPTPPHPTPERHEECLGIL